MLEFTYLNKEILNNNPALFHINRAGATENVKEDFDILRNNTYPYCVLHYIICGSGMLEYRGKEYSLRTGQLFVLNAYEGHRYRTDPCERLGLRWVEFDGGNSVELLRSFLKNQSPVLNPPVSSRINQYIIRIMKLISRDPVKNEILISKIIYAILLNFACINHIDTENDITVSAANGVKKAIEYINHHLDQDLSIKSLALISNFNPAYFSRLFHRITGMTPARYILRKRINNAKELLSTTIPIEQLSEELGFCNTSHFIKLFKKAEGLTPGEYRRQSLYFQQFGKGYFNESH